MERYIHDIHQLRSELAQTAPHIIDESDEETMDFWLTKPVDEEALDAIVKQVVFLRPKHRLDVDSRWCLTFQGLAGPRSAEELHVVQVAPWEFRYLTEEERTELQDAPPTA